MCDRLKLGSTAAPDQNKGRYHKKDLLLLLVFGGIGIDIYDEKQGSLFRKYFPAFPSPNSSISVSVVEFQAEKSKNLDFQQQI